MKPTLKWAALGATLCLLTGCASTQQSGQTTAPPASLGAPAVSSPAPQTAPSLEGALRKDAIRTALQDARTDTGFRGWIPTEEPPGDWSGTVAYDKNRTYCLLLLSQKNSVNEVKLQIQVTPAGADAVESPNNVSLLMKNATPYEVGWGVSFIRSGKAIFIYVNTNDTGTLTQAVEWMNRLN